MQPKIVMPLGAISISLNLKFYQNQILVRQTQEQVPDYLLSSERAHPHITGPHRFHLDVNQALPFKSQIGTTDGNKQTPPDSTKAFLCLSEDATLHELTHGRRNNCFISKR